MIGVFIGEPVRGGIHNVMMRHTKQLTPQYIQKTHSYFCDHMFSLDFNIQGQRYANLKKFGTL